MVAEPDHPGAVVQDDRLAGRDRVGGLVELDQHLVALEPRGDRDLLAVRAQLGLAPGSLCGRRRAAPPRLGRRSAAGPRAPRADPTVTVRSTGRDVQHEARLAVGGRRTDLQALALADGEAVGALVLAELRCPAQSTMSPGASPSCLLEEARGVAVGNEADVVAVRLGRHRQAAALGLGPDLGLGVSPSGKNACSSCSWVSTPSTYDWSLAGSTARCSSRPPSGVSTICA